ncbi:MAG: SMP-30/gluconolactonase/LRE family protein [Actinomycetota bacterium]
MANLHLKRAGEFLIILLAVTNQVGCRRNLSAITPESNLGIQETEPLKVVTKSTTKQENKMMKTALFDRNASLEKVAGNFQFLEGPVWHPEGFLLFSDIPGNTIYKLTSNQKIEVFRRPSGNANGNILDQENRLVTAEQEGRRVTRTEPNGQVINLTDRYNGKRLNSPNDLVIKSDGSLYFTDPPYGISKEQEELGFSGVYRLSMDGTLTLLLQDFVRPNGIAFSPDEKKLYVNDSEKKHIRVFEVNPDGTVVNGRIFAELKDPNHSGLPDGMKVDVEGNIYCAGPGGVWIFSPEGELLDKIEVPEYTTNLAWGDRDYQTLYITADKSLYRIRLNIAGVRPGFSPP